MDRRDALKLMAAGAILPATGGLAMDAEAKTPTKSAARMPTVYLPHGGGPWPWMDEPFGDPAELSELTSFLKSVKQMPAQKPVALLVVSAHWEEKAPTVMTAVKPPMLYDYYGFPPETYKVQWPAPGHPVLAARVRELLEKAGFSTGADPARGFDHGTFVPLKLTYPDAEIPVVQLSLKKGLDPAEHLAMGRALAPLRDEGIFIVGSGMSYHNMRGFMDPRAQPASAAFDAWLHGAVTQPADQRAESLKRWAEAPGGRASHPREEHLLPLMVIAGAAGNDAGHVAYASALMGVRVSAFRFG